MQPPNPNPSSYPNPKIHLWHHFPPALLRRIMLQWFRRQKRRIQSYHDPWVSPQKTLLEKLWRKYEDAEAESQVNTEAEAEAEAAEREAAGLPPLPH
jgi:DNA-directed RNA polymerase specialized sigma24 family protein